MNLKYTMLNTLPDEIKILRVKLFKMATEVEIVVTQIKTWESVEMISIENKTDHNGKPAFSNAEKRKVELERRKSSNELISELERRHEAIKKVYEELRIEVQYKYDIQENLRALARIEGGQV